MSYHKELLTEILQDWTTDQIDQYILSLVVRKSELDDWIRTVQNVKRKRKSKSTPENGPRDGR
jgi:hypothetical protein